MITNQPNQVLPTPYSKKDLVELGCSVNSQIRKVGTHLARYGIKATSMAISPPAIMFPVWPSLPLVLFTQPTYISPICYVMRGLSYFTKYTRSAPYKAHLAFYRLLLSTTLAIRPSYCWSTQHTRYRNPDSQPVVAQPTIKNYKKTNYTANKR